MCDAQLARGIFPAIFYHDMIFFLLCFGNFSFPFLPWKFVKAATYEMFEKKNKD